MQEALLAGLASQAPFERVGNPEETAAVAWFLASDDSSFMTGSEVFVEGGLRRPDHQCERGCALRVSSRNSKSAEGRTCAGHGGSRGKGDPIILPVS